MKIKALRIKQLTLALLACAPFAASAQDDPITILVEKSTLLETGWLRGEPTGTLSIPVDGGDFLRGFTGVSGSRMGGRAIDPVIRGQNQTRLNILLDGAFVHGGCPNRMDPPAGYASPETYDKVTVIKGNQTVRHGGGGSGGAVLFERETPRFSESESYRGRASAGYTSNTSLAETALDLAAGTAQGYVRAIGQYADADNYQDGSGHEVHSGYNTRAGNLLLGYTPDDHTRVELGLEAIREKDVLYAGAGMDAPHSDNDILRLKFARETKTGPFAGLRGEVYRSEVEHLMDNYSLRPLAAGSMKMAAPTTSETAGGRFSADWAGARGVLTLGLDYQQNQRDATRLSGPATMPTPAMLQSVLWPDVELEQTGLFGEWLVPMGAGDTVRLGLRYDRVSASAGKAGLEAMGGMSPNKLYRMYYGIDGADHEENNWGGVLRYEHPLNETTQVFAGFSRSLRTADATERYFASNSSTAAGRWVGNPGLSPEQHHQLELGLSRREKQWDSLFTVFYNQVGDYILRDRAHGQAGILLSDNAAIYRNVDARLMGLEWEAGVRWQANWAARLGLAYVHATNTSDDQPIAQTPPLEGNFSLDYFHAKGLVGAKVRFAARQTRVDDNMLTGSGLDARETPGFGVLDVYGTWQVSKLLEARLGVNNVFDSTYAYHVNRANADPFNPQAVQVNEPGRSLWLKLSARF